DPDGDSLTYRWQDGSTTLGIDSTLSVPLPIGAHTITLTVDDGHQKTGTIDVLVVVQDTTAPALSGGPDDIRLEATGPSGATASGAGPNALRPLGRPVPVTCRAA